MAPTRNPPARGPSRPGLLCVGLPARSLRALERAAARQLQVLEPAGTLEDSARVLSDPALAVAVVDLVSTSPQQEAWLELLRAECPRVVRIGLADPSALSHAIDALIGGLVSRLALTSWDVARVGHELLEAVAEHESRVVEHARLGESRQASTGALIGSLALVRPEAHAAAVEAERTTVEVMRALGVDPSWEVRAAVQLCHLEALALPEGRWLSRMDPKALSRPERERVARAREVPELLCARLPGLELARHILAYRHKDFDGRGLPRDGVQGMDIPLASRVIRVVLDQQRLTWAGLEPERALATLRRRNGSYDPQVLDAVHARSGGARQEADPTRRWVEVEDLMEQMTLEEDLVSCDGMLLAPAGTEVSQILIERLRNFARYRRLRQPFRVRVGGVRRG